MSSQNLISAVLTPETKTEIVLKLTEIKTKLDFLLALQPDDVKGFSKPVTVTFPSSTGPIAL